MANEFNTPNECGTSGKEFYYPSEEAIRFSEYEHPVDDGGGKSKDKLSAKMRKMVYLLAACGSVASLSIAGFLVPAGPVVEPEPEIVEQTENIVTEPEPVQAPVLGFYDNSFPELPNPDPNSFVPQYGYLDEEYIYIRSNDQIEILRAGAARPDLQASLVTGDDAMYYDESLNTVFLKNVDLDYFEINLMGNSFTLDISGECNIGQIKCWGFFVGGSLKITGDGTLNIGAGEYGIDMDGESSETCLMVDQNVKVNIQGSVAAIRISNTTMDQAIYCLSPVDPSLTRGFDSDNNYTVFDENQNVAKEVSFNQF